MAIAGLFVGLAVSAGAAIGIFAFFLFLPNDLDLDFSELRMFIGSIVVLVVVVAIGGTAIIASVRHFRPSNPYAAPESTSNEPSQGTADRESLPKIEAIIQDASQLWLALGFALVSGGVGGLMIGPWYLMRLMQWNSIAKQQPNLTDPNVDPGTIAQRFRDAKPKLVIGLMLGLITLFVAVAVLMKVANS